MLLNNFKNLSVATLTQLLTKFVISEHSSFVQLDIVLLVKVDFHVWAVLLVGFASLETTELKWVLVNLALFLFFLSHFVKLLGILLI